MGSIAQIVRRFFHPAAIDEMLSTFLPSVDGNNLSVSSHHNCIRGLTPFMCLLLPEYPSITILHADVLAAFTPSILPPHALPTMGIRELLYV